MTARGMAWQAQLDRLHDRYRRDRLALVYRTNPPVRVLQDRGEQFLGAWAGNGPPDYFGLIAGEPALGVAFDAKDCAATRWPLASLERHQARDLEAVHVQGGIAGIALRLAGDAYWLTWHHLGPVYWAWLEREERAARGTASLGVERWFRPFDVQGEGWLPVAVRP